MIKKMIKSKYPLVQGLQSCKDGDSTEVFDSYIGPK